MGVPPRDYLDLIYHPYPERRLGIWYYFHLHTNGDSINTDEGEHKQH